MTRGRWSESLTSTLEACEILAATLLGKQQTIMHHLSWECRRFQLVAHAVLISGLDDSAASSWWGRRVCPLYVVETSEEGAGATRCGMGLSYHGEEHEQTDAESSDLCGCHLSQIWGLWSWLRREVDSGKRGSGSWWKQVEAKHGLYSLLLVHLHLMNWWSWSAAFKTGGPACCSRHCHRCCHDVSPSHQPPVPPYADSHRFFFPQTVHKIV